MAKRANSKKSPDLKGAVIAHVHQKGKGYGSGASSLIYRQLKKLHVNSVQFNTFAAQNDISSTALQWHDPSLTQTNLSKEIDDARSAGFTIMLKPHIWVRSYYESKEQWRSKINFKDAKTRKIWFSNYFEFLRWNLEAAPNSKIDFFVIGTELVGLSKYAKNWQNLIVKIRKIYNGKLGYAAESWNAPNIKFWKDLDFIGLDVYKKYSGSIHDSKAIVRFYKRELQKMFSFSKALAKNLVFTEFGFPAHKAAISKPWSWPTESSVADDAMQNKAYDCLRIALDE